MFNSISENFIRKMLQEMMPEMMQKMMQATIRAVTRPFSWLFELTAECFKLAATPAVCWW